MYVLCFACTLSSTLELNLTNHEERTPPVLPVLEQQWLAELFKCVLAATVKGGAHPEVGAFRLGCYGKVYCNINLMPGWKGNVCTLTVPQRVREKKGLESANQSPLFHITRLAAWIQLLCLPLRFVGLLLMAAVGYVLDYSRILSPPPVTRDCVTVKSCFLLFCCSIILFYATLYLGLLWCFDACFYVTVRQKVKNRAC